MLIWGNRRKIIHGFKTWHFLASHQICHVYYICCTSWPDFPSLRFRNYTCHFLPTWVREAGKEGGHCGLETEEKEGGLWSHSGQGPNAGPGVESCIIESCSIAWLCSGLHSLSLTPPSVRWEYFLVPRHDARIKGASNLHSAHIWLHTQQVILYHDNNISISTALMELLSSLQYLLESHNSKH